MLPRALLALALVAAASVPVALEATPVAAAPARAGAPAWSDGACAPDDNVSITVVIDFQELGGGVNLRCTDGPVTDGADALDEAGINWQGVVRWGRGFVCKIAGKPGNDPCIDTPPASAYWSYWLAERRGTWCYANFGVLNRTPPPGSVEGWSFSLNQQDGTSPSPRHPPPALAPGLEPNRLPGNDCDPGGGTVVTLPPATTTTTRPSGGGRPTPTTRPTGLGGDPGRPGGPAATSTPAGGASTTTTAAGATTTEPGNSTTTTARSGAAEEPGDDDGSEAATAGAGSPADSEGAVPANQVDLSTDGNEQTGFPLSTVVGVGLVVALGAGAVLARRRRS